MLQSARQSGTKISGNHHSFCGLDADEATIRLHDKAGNVIETHEHVGDSESRDPDVPRKPNAPTELPAGKLPTRIYPPAGACFMFV
jgi:hypothetical protein